LVSGGSIRLGGAVVRVKDAEETRIGQIPLRT
jgi:hypothetical protein